MVACREAAGGNVQEFRADAKAEGDDIGVGGWLVHPDGPMSSKWFRLKLDRKTAPWAYRTGEPFRTIASLELFATLLCIKAFKLDAGDIAGGRVTLSGLTDNKGNSHVISRLMTVKFPLCAFLMEIAATLQRAESDLDLGWVPRDQNTKADELSNFDARHFNPELEVVMDRSVMDFILLDEFLEEGEKLYLKIAENKLAIKASAPLAPPIAKRRKRKPETRLRATHPW